MNLSKEKIIRSARSSVPVEIKTFTLPHETEIYLEEVLEIFLKELGRSEIKDKLAYCLRELAVNAKKANTKRVFFEDKELDINNPQDYAKGMKTFKEETLSNINYWLEKQKKKGLFIKVTFHLSGKTFRIVIRNNVEITRKEQMRVYDRIARSRAYDSMEEVFSEIMDDSEGAGLGIVIMILMLRNIGLDEDAYDIDTEGGETVTTLTIPMSQVHEKNIDLLSETIVQEIDALPAFPENIVFLQKLINDPESEITSIAKQVSTDPSLTADLLKLVNSAQFMLPRKVDNIVEAVKMVGLRGLKNLLYSYGTEKILKDNSQQQKLLWEHSYRTAFYAYNLARGLRRSQELLDDSYVGGILHDMGKIVFSNLHPNLLDKIRQFTGEKEIPGQLLEDLSAGMNHAEIGAQIAEKWNFPEGLIEAIRYHHEPQNCSSNYTDVVNSVYLANAVCEYQRGSIGFSQISKGVLQRFRIRSEEQIQDLAEKLTQSFEEEKNRK